MKYVHKSRRAALPAAPPIPPALPPAPLPEKAVAPAAPPVSRALLDATWAVVLGHRQFIRAGVPGCSCGVTFDSHATFVADHTQHLTQEVVTHVLTFLLRAAEGESQEVPSAVQLLSSMMAAAPVLEGAPA